MNALVDGEESIGWWHFTSFYV